MQESTVFLLPLSIELASPSRYLDLITYYLHPTNGPSVRRLQVGRYNMSTGMIWIIGLCLFEKCSSSSFPPSRSRHSASLVRLSCALIFRSFELGLPLHLITFGSLISFFHLRQVRKHWACAPTICESTSRTIFYVTNCIPYWRKPWGISCVGIIS